MAKAIWNGTVLADSDETIVVEGNHYFPPSSINKNHFKPSKTQSTCPWKGEAAYFNVVVDDKTNEDAAWTYPDPKKEAEHFKDYVAFWRGVQIET